MHFRKSLVGIIFFLILIWAPIDHSQASWLLIRSIQLIGIPLIIWFLLKWVWNKWQPSEKLNELLERALAGVVCVGLIVWTVFEATSSEHAENTKWIRTRDGQEPVGDWITLKGADWGNVFMLLLATAFVFYLGVLKKGINKSK